MTFPFLISTKRQCRGCVASARPLFACRGTIHRALGGIFHGCHAGIVCTGETYKHHVKLTFAKGAALRDPKRLFNSSLEGNIRRAVDIHEGEKLNEPALKDLIREAVALNLHLQAKGKPKARRAAGKHGKPAR